MYSRVFEAEIGDSTRKSFQQIQNFFHKKRQRRKKKEKKTTHETTVTSDTSFRSKSTARNSNKLPLIYELIIIIIN